MESKNSMLRRRIITSLTSLVLAFNMVSILPMNTFADESSEKISTVGYEESVNELSPYTIFSGSSVKNLELSQINLNCSKGSINGNVYTGAGFVSNVSELTLNGRVDAVNNITTNGYKININEKNENAEKQDMPDWDARIHKMAGNLETKDEDITTMNNQNVMNSSVKTNGKVEIGGTSFDGNCYIIAEGDITYTVDKFISSGRVVLYSRNGNVNINGSNIDFNGIIYAPNGSVNFSTSTANINGRIFANSINLNGSEFSITGNSSDWELIGSDEIEFVYAMGEYNKDNNCIDIEWVSNPEGEIMKFYVQMTMKITHLSELLQVKTSISMQ